MYVVHLIISACVLHNFCIIHDDFYDGYIDDDGFGDDDPHDSGNQPDGRAEQKRTHLMNTKGGNQATLEAGTTPASSR